MVEKIRSKEWQGGSQIPNEQLLSEEFAVSQGTIRKALSVLEEENLVRREQGRGTFVTAIDSQQIAFRFYAIKGFEGYPTSSETEIEVAPASELEQERLALHPAHNVIHINRMRLSDDQPLMIEHICVPQRLFPDLAEDQDISSFFLLTSFVKAGLIPKKAVERITAINADEQMAEKLNVAPGKALLRTERVVFDVSDKPFEYRIRICNLGDGYYEANLP